MTVIPPSEKRLAKSSNLAYTAGLAGSGFVADVTVMPTNVSFSRIQAQEGEVEASASGYYDTVLGWDKIKHPAGRWITPDASNGGFSDTVGTVPPGTGGPFSEGEFIWPIPQSYRKVGSSGSGIPFSTSFHVQVMTGSNGAEGTAKQGASRGRVP